MSADLSIADITTYLSATGWQREPENWRNGEIWTSAEGHQVLLPAREGLGDGELRVRELLEVLARVEHRPAHDVALEIDSPRTDSQTYRLSSDEPSIASVPLGAGVRTLNGLRQILDSAGRAYVEGPHVTFPGRTPRRVQELLSSTRLSSDSLFGSMFRIQLPLVEADRNASIDVPFARRVGVQLYDAVGSANEAASTVVDAGGDLTGFDDALTAGVSANLCQALSDLGGSDRRQPFEISFGWARDIPSDLPASTIRIEAGRAAVLAAAARYLRRLSTSGDALVTGVVESLHDDANRADRWRIKIRGEVTGTRGVSARRTLWVRLDNPRAYDLAIQAHREQQIVRAEGVAAVLNGRLELITRAADFSLLG